MKLSGILVALSVGAWGLSSTLLSTDVANAVFLGMAGPLVLCLATLLIVKQTARTDIGRLTKRLTTAFIAKMVFYAGYVSVVVGVLATDPIPFSISFTLCFLGLQLIEALYLNTLVTRSGRKTIDIG